MQRSKQPVCPPIADTNDDHPHGTGDSATDDPIFSAIEAKRKSWRDVEAAMDAEGDLIAALPEADAEAERDHPRVQYGMHQGFPHYLLSREKIDELAACSGPNHHRRLLEVFDADEAWLTEAWQRTGVGAARVRVDKALEADASQLRAAVATIPSTLAGVVAFVEFLRREVFECPDGAPDDPTIKPLAWETLDAALRNRLSAPHSAGPSFIAAEPDATGPMFAAIDTRKSADSRPASRHLQR